jgi:hypothetical protein
MYTSGAQSRSPSRLENLYVTELKGDVVLGGGYRAECGGPQRGMGWGDSQTLCSAAGLAVAKTGAKSIPVWVSVQSVFRETAGTAMVCAGGSAGRGTGACGCAGAGRGRGCWLAEGHWPGPIHLVAGQGTSCPSCESDTEETGSISTTTQYPCLPRHHTKAPDRCQLRNRLRCQARSRCQQETSAHILHCSCSQGVETTRGGSAWQLFFLNLSVSWIFNSFNF